MGNRRLAYSDSTIRPVSHLAVAVSPRTMSLLVVALGCLGLAVYFAGAVAGMVFLAAGLSLACLSAVITFLSWRDRARQRLFWEAAKASVEKDRVACLATDADGRILFRNPAAEARFGAGKPVLAEVLDGLFAAPEAVVRRLRRDADRNGQASEKIAATGGSLRLSVHRIDQDYLWRVEESLAANAPKDPPIALPMMQISKAGTILDMNSAMEELLGRRPRTLDRVVLQLPLHPGRLHQIDTASGPIEAHLAVVEDTGGTRQIFVWPGEAPDGNWTHSDALPVPLMKISQSGEILMANRRAQKLLGISDTEELDFADVVEGLGRPVDDWLMDVSEGRGANRTEVVRATRPQQEVFLQVSLGRMMQGSDVSLLAVLIDATELKTLEAQFVQSQKMQAIGQLAGGVAHDFNNLLTAISGHCDLLLLRHEPDDPNYGDLVQINQNANRAASLVGQLLAFSRKQNMQPELIDLRDTLGDLTHLLNRLVGEKIDLSWSHDPDLPRIRADKRQLEQVLMNLVVNARDAMPQGGKIKVETRATRLAQPLTRDRAEVPPGEYVVVTVEDEGCGIPADKLPKIFEPFYSTKGLGEGTGLGLSMAYGIVKQSGGFIFADSVLNSGTSFTIYFPAHRGTVDFKDKAPAAVTTNGTPQDGGVVLLVEDEAPVRAFASRALRLRGYEVIEAESAEEALEKLEDGTLEVDIFVTDVVMPGMDGPSWVSEALKKRPGVKVIFVSGYAEDSFSHKRAKIPNSDFLPKPFSLSQLTETVQGQIH